MRVSAKNLSKNFDDGAGVVHIFDSVNLEIAEVDSIAIVGESGVGKTTLLYILAGMERSTTGEIIVGEENLTNILSDDQALANFRSNHLGFIFQFHNLLPEFDAIENVAMPLIIRGEVRQEAYLKAEELLVRVGLSHRLKHRPTMLSGGEQQRVAVARALVGEPGLVLADEPTGNLDQKTGLEINNLILELQDTAGFSLLTVTHNLELACTLKRVEELTSTGLVSRSKGEMYGSL